MAELCQRREYRGKKYGWTVGWLPGGHGWVEMVSPGTQAGGKSLISNLLYQVFFVPMPVDAHRNRARFLEAQRTRQINRRLEEAPPGRFSGLPHTCCSDHNLFTCSRHGGS